MAEQDSLKRNDSFMNENNNADTSSSNQKDSDLKKESNNGAETKNGSVFSIVLVSVLAIVMLGSVIYSFDRRNTIYNMVSSYNHELDLAEAENVRLQSELDSKMSAKNVEEYAENVLGMQKIDSSQIQYIEIQTNDVVNIPQQDESLLSKVKGIFDSCVEYFRG